MLHREPSIRIAALSLLVTNFSTVKPFTTAATNAILRALPSMHADSDSYTRGEIMSLTRKFIIRLKSGVLKEQSISEAAVPTTGKEPLGWIRSDDETKEFLRLYIQFLQKDMVVTASYPRHVSSLKALKLLLQSGLDPRADIAPLKSEVESRWKLHLDVFEPRLLRLLVDLLLDPFEEVRQTSLSIINLFPRQILLSGLSDAAERQPAIGMRLTDALTRAESIASKTSRADNADTVACLYQILFCAASNSFGAVSHWWETKQSVVNTILSKLEERLSSSNGLFNSTLREAPLHGYMSGLRYFLYHLQGVPLLTAKLDISFFCPTFMPYSRHSPTLVYGDLFMTGYLPFATGSGRKSSQCCALTLPRVTLMSRPKISQWVQRTSFPTPGELCANRGMGRTSCQMIVLLTGIVFSFMLHC